MVTYTPGAATGDIPYCEASDLGHRNSRTGATASARASTYWRGRALSGLLAIRLVARRGSEALRDLWSRAGPPMPARRFAKRPLRGTRPLWSPRMIHIATVHWKSDRWIDHQQDAFERYVPQPYSVYAFLNDLPRDRQDRFFYASQEPIASHATKLDILADLAFFNAASDDDVLIFIDGDALPVSSISRLLSSKLVDARLIAVQRYENNGDIQPHPCFCVTTVGFWHELESDWHPGETWLDLDGNEKTDPGGNLLAVLKERDIVWLPLTRVNRLNPHPVLFGLYGDDDGPLVYHHGAGSRPAITRADRAAVRERAQAQALARLVDLLPERRPFRRLRQRLDPLPRLEQETLTATEHLSEEWFSRLSEDHEAWRALL